MTARPVARRVRQALLPLLVALATLSTSAASPASPAVAGTTGVVEDSAGPNIVVVMVDDQPALDGRIMQKVPIVKSVFADTGVTFTDFHSETPLCCPARAGFFTGQHTHNHRVVTNHARLFNPAMSVATSLSAAGYYTFLIGKYMNSYGRRNCNKTANCAPTIPPGWSKWAAFGDPAYYDYDLWIGDGVGQAIPHHYGSASADYSTDVIADFAVETIRSAPAGKPMLGWIAPHAPHIPSTAPPRYRSASCAIDAWTPPNWNEADVSDKPAYVRALPLLSGPADWRRACRSMLAVDDLVGRVRDALAAARRLENTLFIYMGDNGMQMGEHRLPLKSAPYQTQIPFYVSWPAVLGTTPRTIGERVQSIDLAPTLVELAGTTIGPFPNGQTEPDGVSFVDLLVGRTLTLGRDAVLDEMLTSWPGVPPWNAVTTTTSSPLAPVGCAGASSGLCRWHYVEYPTTGERELYDISNGPCWEWSPEEVGDPCELGNVVDDPRYAEIVSALDARLAELVAERGGR